MPKPNQNSNKSEAHNETFQVRRNGLVFTYKNHSLSNLNMNALCLLVKLQFQSWNFNAEEKNLWKFLAGESNTWLDFIKSYLSLPYLYITHRVKTLIVTDLVFMHNKAGDVAWVLLNKYSL